MKEYWKNIIGGSVRHFWQQDKPTNALFPDTRSLCGIYKHHPMLRSDVSLPRCKNCLRALEK